MKKTIALLLAILMLAPLCACSSSAPDEDDGEEGEKQEETIKNENDCQHDKQIVEAIVGFVKASPDSGEENYLPLIDFVLLCKECKTLTVSSNAQEIDGCDHLWEKTKIDCPQATYTRGICDKCQKKNIFDFTLNSCDHSWELGEEYSLCKLCGYECTHSCIGSFQLGNVNTGNITLNPVTHTSFDTIPQETSTDLPVLTLAQRCYGCGWKFYSSNIETDEQKPETDEQKPETDEQKPETDEQEIHDLQYYLSLPDKKQGNYISVNYSGQIVIDNEIYQTAPTYRQMIDKYPYFEDTKDLYMDPYTGRQMLYVESPVVVFLTMVNWNEVPTQYIDLTMNKIYFEIAEDTKLIDVLGEQSQAIDETMTFIDAAIEVLGLPYMANELDNGNVELWFDYTSCSITIEYNIEANTGVLKIEYK